MDTEIPPHQGCNGGSFEKGAARRRDRQRGSLDDEFGIVPDIDPVVPEPPGNEDEGDIEE